MIIRPRTLEEIAQEQASAEPVTPQTEQAPATDRSAPSNSLEPPVPSREPSYGRRHESSTPAARGEIKSDLAPPRKTSGAEQEGLWDPFDDTDPDGNANSPTGNGLDDPDVPRRRTPDLWKPAEDPKDAKTRLRTWGIALGAMGLTVGAVWFAFNLTSLATSETAERMKAATTEWLGPPQPIQVTVVLINECPFSERAFMAKVMPDGPTAEFVDGEAFLEALPNQRIKLIANTKYPQFHYDSGSFPVGPEV
ncbi:MAG: hypothetical protein RLZZ344_815, partial [Pseudomonadota bacterium]